MIKLIEAVTEYHGFDYAEELGKWKDFDVYRLGMDESDVVIGLPLFILVDGESIRLNTPEETFDIYDYFYPSNN